MPFAATLMRMVGGIILVMVLGFVFGNAPVSAKMGRVTVEKGQFSHVFNVEIAAREQDRAIGLMYRHSLDENDGMLFDFLENKHISMWMKNTYIPLDMLFISANGVIRRIEDHTIPFSTSSVLSGVPVRYVLEVNGGTAQRLGIVPGDKVIFSWMSW